MSACLGWMISIKQHYKGYFPFFFFQHFSTDQIMYYNNKQEDKPTKREGSPSRFTLPPISSTTHASTPLPPLPKKHEPTAFYPYQQQQQQQSQRQQSRSQHEQQNKSTYSYSPYLESNDHIVMQQHEEYYYPVYNNTNNKPAWSEGKIKHKEIWKCLLISI